jgi:hypothetical protein
MEAVEGDRATAAGKPDAVGHLGDRADACIVIVVAGDEQHALLGPDVHGQGHVHVREDDDVLQRDEQHRAHGQTTLLLGWLSFQHYLQKV